MDRGEAEMRRLPVTEDEENEWETFTFDGKRESGVVGHGIRCLDRKGRLSEAVWWGDVLGPI